jgi:alpha-L-rhamnosidase
VPKAPLTAASASLNVPYGKVASSWEITEGIFNLKVTIPPNTTAKVIMPGRIEAVEENSSVKEISENTLQVEPGTYTFTSKL